MASRTGSCEFVIAHTKFAANEYTGELVPLWISEASLYCWTILRMCSNVLETFCLRQWLVSATYVIELSVAQWALVVPVQHQQLQNALSANVFVTTFAKSNHLCPETM